MAAPLSTSNLVLTDATPPSADPQERGRLASAVSRRIAIHISEPDRRGDGSTMGRRHAVTPVCGPLFGIHMMGDIR
ncbi:hypothetical protein GCM10022206_80470 [Streptomyces chiangmaiensis]